jgi:DNA-binding CsgD family transcriptional regulator
VEGHRANLSAKLGLHSRVEFVRYAREHALIE